MNSIIARESRNPVGKTYRGKPQGKKKGECTDRAVFSLSPSIFYLKPISSSFAEGADIFYSIQKSQTSLK